MTQKFFQYTIMWKKNTKQYNYPIFNLFPNSSILFLLKHTHTYT